MGKCSDKKNPKTWRAENVTVKGCLNLLQGLFFYYRGERQKSHSDNDVTVCAARPQNICIYERKRMRVAI